MTSLPPNIFLNSRMKGTVVLEVFRAKGQFSVDWPPVHDIIRGFHSAYCHLLFVYAEAYHKRTYCRRGKRLTFPDLRKAPDVIHIICFLMRTAVL